MLIEAVPDPSERRRSTLASNSFLKQGKTCFFPPICGFFKIPSSISMKILMQHSNKA
ncbi:hypothetical protein ES703_10819 [subsurface metagenome]